MDYVWELIQPYVLAVIAFLSGSGITAVILRAVVKKLFTKNSEKLEQAYNTEKSKMRNAGRSGKPYSIKRTQTLSAYQPKETRSSCRPYTVYDLTGYR